MVYRGDLLPETYQGNAFVCEPAGNLLKRNVVNQSGPNLSAYDPNPGEEFLASTDERFRPVYLANGPEGALYIADMYRGVNQHGAYMTPYLREQIIQRKLDAPINKGRIWRIVPEDWTQQAGPKLSLASTDALIEALSADNGWARDAAQRLLIERNDPASIPQLEQLLQDGQHELGQLHALWTLEGLGVIEGDLLLQVWDNVSPSVQIAALRILESFAEEDPAVQELFMSKLNAHWSSAKPEVVLQIALSAGILRQADKLDLLSQIAQKHVQTPLMRDAILSSLANDEHLFLQQLATDEQWKEADLNREIFFEMLSAAIARKGKPKELMAILQQLDKPEAEYSWQDKAILNGMALQAPQLEAIAVSHQPALLAKAESYPPATQKNLQLLSHLFDWPGKVQTKQVSANTLDEAALKAFAKGRTLYLSSCANCHGTDGRGLKRFAPPLVNSEWVLGDEKKLALVLLHGLEGPIEVNGIAYDAPDILPVMPAHSTMGDGDIAAILTYIRNEWGHQASAVSRRVVGRTRVTSQGRVIPWTAEELLALPTEEKENLQ